MRLSWRWQACWLVHLAVTALVIGPMASDALGQSSGPAVRYSYAKNLAPQSSGDKTVVDQAADFPDFQHFVRAMRATKFADTLAGPGPFTLFAFSDEAFERLPDAYEEFLFSPAGKSKLEKIMGYHVTSGRLLASSMRGQQTVISTLDGASLTVDGQMAFVRVNGTTILSPDILAANGVIHLIDYVIIPPDF